MAFVFTPWYFVMIALVAGIAACLFFFFKMDKKDKVLIDEFIKSNQQESEVESAQEAPKSEDVKTEDVKLEE